MRPFEIATIIMLVSSWGVYLLPRSKRPRWLIVLPTLTALIAIVQFVMEPYRWQMAPIYALVAIHLLLSVLELLRKNPTESPKPKHRKLSIVGKGVRLLIFVFFISLPALFPMFQLPDPTGQYAIGTTAFAFTDDSRPEIFTDDPDDKRLVYVQVWYPAESTAGSPRMRLWIDPEKAAPAAAKDFRLPEFAFSHFAMIQSNSYIDAPLAGQETTYPVLIFSHGYSPGFFAQNTVQMEELASHGYIIFSVGHTYEGAMVFDGQGQAIPASETQVDAFNQEATEKDKLFAKAVLSPEAEQNQAIRTWLAAVPIAQQSIQIWTQDTQYVLTQIEQINRDEVDSPFAGHLDTERIGVFGHSFGGGTAFQVCAVDSRCKAAINLDGTTWGTLLDTPLQTPYLMMYGQLSNGTNDWALKNLPESGYNIWVKGASHINFSDFSLVGSGLKIPGLGILGKIDPQQMERIMNAYTLAFFDQTLKGIPSSLLQGNSPDYPEVELKIIGATSK